MNPTETSPPTGHGFRALLWIGVFAFALIMAWLVMMYLVPAPGGSAPWIYPRSKELIVTNHGPIRVRFLASDDGFDLVERWYSDRLMAGSGNPAFVSQSGPFGGRHQQFKIGQMDRVDGQGARLQCELTRRGLTAMIVSRADGDTQTFISLASLEGSFGDVRVGNASQALNALAYPSAKRGSGGASSGTTAFQFTSSDAPDTVWDHYLRQFGVKAGLSLQQGSSVVAIANATTNLLARLPQPVRPGVDERTLLALTTTNLCIIHLWHPTNGTGTDLILGVINR